MIDNCRKNSDARIGPWRFGSTMGLVFCGVLLLGDFGICGTYGVRDSAGNFIPKITVDVGDKEILLKKTDPDEKFRSIVLKVNRKNKSLVHNVSLLQVVWINRNNREGKPLLFSGPRFDAAKLTFKDSMTKSMALKIKDPSTRNLFMDKDFDDLFTLVIQGQRVVSSDSFFEKDRTVRLGAGRDTSINVDRTSIAFNDSNIKKGEFLNVDNRSGFNKTIAVKLPEESLFYYQKIIRKPEQTKVSREKWDRFAIEADSGIFIVLIPDPDPLQLAQLNGKEIQIKVFQGNETTEVIKIPITTSSELRLPDDASASPGGPSREDPGTTGAPTTEPQDQGRAGPSGSPVDVDSGSVKSYAGGGIWLWILLILDLGITAAVAGYVIFFMLPKIQVLEDRLAKNEMFIHGSREAIREELELTKEEILRQCLTDTPTE